MKKWQVKRLPEYESPVKIGAKKILRAWKKRLKAGRVIPKRISGS